MNTDQIAGKWKQLKGTAKQQWGKLTDAEIAERKIAERDQGRLSPNREGLVLSRQAADLAHRHKSRRLPLVHMYGERS